MRKNRRRHYRVTVGDAIAAHENALAASGGRAGVHDIGRIEAAIARPYAGYHLSIHRKAAILAHGVAANHGFLDGNKRTALILVYLFLHKEAATRCAKRRHSLTKTTWNTSFSI